MADVAETRHKRTRKSGSKVKSGCSTCKSVSLSMAPFFTSCHATSLLNLVHHTSQLTSCLSILRARRMKCDETRPACLKCTSSGRRCDGYASPFRAGKQFAFLSDHSNSSSQCDHQISVGTTVWGLPTNIKDRRYFDYFRHRCAREFSGLLGHDFWSRYVLRVSASRPAVQYAVVALGAQHEAYLSRKNCNIYGDFLHQNNSPSLSAYSLEVYRKAIKCLYRHLGSNPNSDANVMEETLVT